MKPLISFVTILTLTTGLVVGCGSKVTSPPPSTGTETKAPEASVYPLTVKDATGTSVEIKEEPKRIVSLLPSETEILFALGLGDKIVGVDKWSDYPAEAKSKPIIGDMNPNPENILAQKPDLVIGGATSNPGLIDSLRKLGLTVYTVEPKSIAEVEQTIKEVGKITNSSAKAEATVTAMGQKVSEIKAKLQGVSDDKKPMVYVEVSPSPDIFTAGKGTFMDELVTLAGGKNVFSDTTGWAKINAEQVLAKNPQFIITTSMGDPTAIEKELTNRRGWDKVIAIKSKNVKAVDPNLVSRPGPRIVDGLEQIAKVIHPELFK